MNSHESNKKSKFELLVEDCINDRRICREAGAKYDRMNSEDVQKVRNYLIRTLLEEQEAYYIRDDEEGQRRYGGNWFV